MDDLDDLGLPKSPINLSGYPICPEYGCGVEVATAGTICGAHEGGVVDFSPDILRRRILRQVRGCVLAMRNCQKCVDLRLNEERCTMCAWFRGAGMTSAGLGEIYGWSSDYQLLIGLIGIREKRRGEFRAATGKMMSGPHG